MTEGIAVIAEIAVIARDREKQNFEESDDLAQRDRVIGKADGNIRIHRGDAEARRVIRFEMPLRAMKDSGFHET
jgi:hypothetical protein